MGSANPVAAVVLGGWQLSGVFTRSSGLPFTETTSGGIANAGGANISGAGVGQITSADDSRRVQLGLKLLF